MFFSATGTMPLRSGRLIAIFDPAERKTIITLEPDAKDPSTVDGHFTLAASGHYRLTFARRQRCREPRTARGNADFCSRPTAAGGHSRTRADRRGGRGLESARDGAGGRRRGHRSHCVVMPASTAGDPIRCRSSSKTRSRTSRGDNTRSTWGNSGRRRATSSRITPRPTTTIRAAATSPTRRRR